PWLHSGGRQASSARSRSEAGVDRVDEGAVTRVLPARPHVVHHVAERQVGLGIAEPERAAGAEVPERAGVRSERALRLRQLKAEREAGGTLSPRSTKLDATASRT